MVLPFFPQATHGVEITHKTFSGHHGFMCTCTNHYHVDFTEYCLRYAKPEDIGVAPEENSSDDEELSDAESDSGDEGVVGKADP